MISSFFGKVRPINYIVLLGFIFAYYWFVHFVMFETPFNLGDFFLKSVVLAILCFTTYVINFIVKRNRITGSNSYAILFFTLLLLIFPHTIIMGKVILCNFFLLLALRRLISLRSLKSIKPKLFDATLWIVTASIFYDWALIYLILVYIAIYIYEPKSIRNWLVPLAGVFTVFMIGYGFLILGNYAEFISEHYKFNYIFDPAFFTDLEHSYKLGVYVIGILIIGFFSFLGAGNAVIGKVATLWLIAITFILGLIFQVLVDDKGQLPILITFFPASVFLAKYVESIKKAKIKEIVLILSIAASFMIFLIDWAIE